MPQVVNAVLFLSVLCSVDNYFI